MTHNKFFNKEKQEQTKEWFKDKWKNQGCECCGNNAWTLSNDIVVPIPIYNLHTLNLNGGSYPQIMVICNSCGNTKYFNAILASIVPSKTENSGGTDGK